MSAATPEPAATTFLPPGPYRVRSGYAGRRVVSAWVLRLLALLIAIGGAFYVQDGVRTLLHDQALVDDAEAREVPADFQGRVESRLGLLPSYRGTVRYDLPDGKEFSAKIDFSTLWKIDTQVPPTVRFRAAAPTDFVLNWAGTALGSRWVTLALLGGVLMLGFPALLWYLGRNVARRVDLVRALAAAGHELVLPLVAVTEQKQYGRVTRRTYASRLPGEGKPRKVQESWRPKHGGPCFVAPGQMLAVASVHEPDQALLLREDLWPLELPADVAAAVTARVAGAFAAAGGTAAAEERG